MCVARLSRDAALQVSGVAGVDPGPRGLAVTADAHQRIEGVRCIAGNGGFEVRLYLRCELVALLKLAETVRTSVIRVAAAAGIAVADVSVEIVDVVDVVEGERA